MNESPRAAGLSLVPAVAVMSDSTQRGEQRLLTNHTHPCTRAQKEQFQRIGRALWVAGDAFPKRFGCVALFVVIAIEMKESRQVGWRWMMCLWKHTLIGASCPWLDVFPHRLNPGQVRPLTLPLHLPPRAGAEEGGDGGGEA